MKPVSFLKIVVGYLDACCCHFGASACLMVTPAVSLGDSCQIELCIRRIVPDACCSLLCLVCLGYGPYRDSGMRAGLKILANVL